MNFGHSLVFAYLEEDNKQRAYFRVHPLLTLDGDIREKAKQLWPNEGGLRIVPDRNEQHTFKVRMRTLGSFCVVDLRNQPAEAGKIRTNKNFRPDRGEVNQYILYSDTVHELPEHTFYQLVDGAVDAYPELAKEAITPLFFIRDADTLYGPVRRDEPQKPETAKAAAALLVDILCPDGMNRIMLCIDDSDDSDKRPHFDESQETTQTEDSPVSPSEESIPKAEDKTSSAAEQIPLGTKLQILDENLNHEDTLEQLNKPVSQDSNLLHPQDSFSLPVSNASTENNGVLSGTPFVQSPLHVSAQQNKNRVQEIVNNQWSVGKYQPPAQNLPAGTTMRSVSNPVENACLYLKDAWNTGTAHEQLLDFMLSLDGLKREVERKLCKGENVTLMQRVLRQRLQDLEAERLIALCELDRAHRDVEAYKNELLSTLANRIAQDTSKLEANRQAAQDQLVLLKQEINGLTVQKDVLLAKVNELQCSALPETAARLLSEMQLVAPAAGVPLRITPVAGDLVDANELIARVQAIFSSCGISVNRNGVIALLTLLALCPRIGFITPAPAALSTLIANFMRGMGWAESYAHQYAAEQHPLVGMRPVDSTPSFLATSLPNYAPISGVTKLILSRTASGITRDAAYEVCQWPVFSLTELPFVPEVSFNDAKPVSAFSLHHFAQKECATADELDLILSPVLNAAIPLSGAARKELYRFVSVCAGLMEGGLPVAADWGIALWIVPALERGSRQHSSVKTLLDEFPLSLSRL